MDSENYNVKLIKFYEDYYDKNDPKGTCEKYSINAANYEKDTKFLGYPTPQRLAEIAFEMFQGKDSKDMSVLDAGCGTGLVAEYLKNCGFNGSIDGFDGAEGMVELARKKNIFRRLETIFMVKGKESIDFLSNSYDSVTACGFFGNGRIHPSAFGEFLRVTKPGGFIVFSIGKNQPEEYLKELKDISKELEEKGVWKEVRVTEAGYLGRDRSGYLLNSQSKIVGGGYGGNNSDPLLKCSIFCYQKL